jgi:hypothetical protein
MTYLIAVALVVLIVQGIVISLQLRKSNRLLDEIAEIMWDGPDNEEVYEDQLYSADSSVADTRKGY